LVMKVSDSCAQESIEGAAIARASDPDACAEEKEEGEEDESDFLDPLGGMMDGGGSKESRVQKMTDMMEWVNAKCE
jgi:hypothetical protein